MLEETEITLSEDFGLVAGVCREAVSPKALQKLLEPVVRSQFARPADLVPYGALLARLGRNHEALAVLNRAIREDSEDRLWRPCLFLALVYQNPGKALESRGWLDEARRRYHTSKAGQPAFAGNVLLRRERVE
jgi:Flp pilus assembly protein TadD